MLVLIFFFHVSFAGFMTDKIFRPENKNPEDFSSHENENIENAEV